MNIEKILSKHKKYPVYHFEVDNRFEAEFDKVSKQIKSGNFVFKFSKKMDSKKVFKLLGIALDCWKVEKVVHDLSNGWIFVQGIKREKNKFILPSSDHHFKKDQDRYQFHTYLAALGFVSRYKLALDIGGHVGFYSSAMKDSFSEVIAFEPSPSNIKCFLQNVPEVKLIQNGLGSREESVYLNLDPENTGNNSIVEAFDGSKVMINIKTLDSFNFKNIDLIKIDVQGYEEEVLLGAKETLKKEKPIIIAELITHKDNPPNEKALKLLKSYGYEVRMILGKDYILGPVNL